MTRTKKSHTKRGGRGGGSEEKHVKLEPVIHYTPSPTGARVFAVEELLILILRHSDEMTVISKLQRVCRRWRDVSSVLLRPLFDGTPLSIDPEAGGREINPALREHFGRIINDGTRQLNIGLWLTGSHLSHMRSLIDLPIATSGPGRVVHSAYARPGASWRRMQIYHPPIYELRYCRSWEDEVEVVRVEDGLQWGHVYDILVAVTGNTKGFSWNEVRVVWPHTSAGSDSDSESHLRPARDYVFLERERHILPSTCSCSERHRPSSNEKCPFDDRKGTLQRIASNKWRVTSRDFKEENLLVRV